MGVSERISSFFGSTRITLPSSGFATQTAPNPTATDEASGSISTSCATSSDSGSTPKRTQASQPLASPTTHMAPSPKPMVELPLWAREASSGTAVTSRVFGSTRARPSRRAGLCPEGAVSDDAASTRRFGHCDPIGLLARFGIDADDRRLPVPPNRAGAGGETHCMYVQTLRSSFLEVLFCRKLCGSRFLRLVRGRRRLGLVIASAASREEHEGDRKSRARGSQAFGLLAAKNSRNSAAASSAMSPDSTLGRWLSRCSSRMSNTEPAAPAFGSAVA